ncbi:MAG: AI-2E family transporter [Deltaproteobacteria bacterium]|nr:AI-2E family transporter [Deltaproteobacteria bacterium]
MAESDAPSNVPAGMNEDPTARPPVSRRRLFADATEQGVFRALVAFALVVFLLYLLYRLMAPFLVGIGWGIILAVTTFPLYRRLRRALKARETLSAAIMVLAVTLLLVGPTVTFVGLLGKQGVQAYKVLERIGQEGGAVHFLQEKLSPYETHSVIGPWVVKGQVYLQRASTDLETTVTPAMKKVIAAILGLFTATLTNFFSFLLHLAVMLITLGIFYLKGDFLLGQALSLLPLSEARKEVLFHRLDQVMKAVIRGIVLTWAIQGFFGGIGFWATGIPSPVVFGVLTAFSAIVPVVGTTLVWGPGGLYLILAGKTALGVGLLLWGAIVVSRVDAILLPLLIGGKVEIPLPLILVGVVGGVFAFGLMGLVIGPLLLVVTLFFLETYRENLLPPAGVPAEPGE